MDKIHSRKKKHKGALWLDIPVARIQEQRCGSFAGFEVLTAVSPMRAFVYIYVGVRVHD